MKWIETTHTMLINTLTFLILALLLVWHAVRLVSVWRLTRAVPVDSALFIPAVVLQLVAVLSDQDWATWIAVLFLVVIIVVNLRKSSRKLDPPRRNDESWVDRERRVDSDRKSWWEAFAVAARPTEITFEIELGNAIQLRTDEPLPLTLGPGKIRITLGGWEKLLGENPSYEIRLRILVTDTASVAWTSEYRVDIESLVDIGFSSTPKRKPGELRAWSEIDPEVEQTFRENCLVAKAVYHTDAEHWIEAGIGSHDYVVYTRRKRGVIDLAWDEESNTFLLRLAGLFFRERDGIWCDEVEMAHLMSDSDAQPWEPDEIEPVVFPILPEELLPFGMNGLMSPYRFDEEPESWPPLFSRCEGPMLPLGDSGF